MRDYKGLLIYKMYKYNHAMLTEANFLNHISHIRDYKGLLIFKMYKVQSCNADRIFTYIRYISSILLVNSEWSIVNTRNRLHRYKLL